MNVVDSPPFLTPFELHLHGEGTHHESYRSLGAHLMSADGVSGVRFAVWAPNAEQVTLMGDFNGWDGASHPMSHRSGGVWEAFIPGLGQGDHYKYLVRSRSGHTQEKCDPYAFFAEVPPRTASIVWSLNNYAWGDAHWMEQRARRNMLREPVSMYEVHLESWLRGAQGEWLSYQRAGSQARRVREPHGLHACGADAGDGASVFGLVGLPGHRILRAHVALRHARRFPVLHRSSAPARASA